MEHSGISAVLMQTSLAARDMLALPTLASTTRPLFLSGENMTGISNGDATPFSPAQESEDQSGADSATSSSTGATSETKTQKTKTRSLHIQRTLPLFEEEDIALPLEAVIFLVEAAFLIAGLAKDGFLNEDPPTACTKTGARRNSGEEKETILLRQVWKALAPLFIQNIGVRRYFHSRFLEVTDGIFSKSLPKGRPRAKHIWPFVTDITTPLVVPHKQAHVKPTSQLVQGAKRRQNIERSNDLKVDSAVEADADTDTADPRNGLAGFYWLPIHHSNFERIYARDPLENPDAGEKIFGVHSTHYDKELFDAMRGFLDQRKRNDVAERAHEGHLLQQEKSQGNTSPVVEVSFQHIDPNGQFVFTGGHILSPQQTRIVYKTFASFDFTAMRANQNCDAGESRDAWNNTKLVKAFFCSRYKTGQRLLNHFSVGIPAIVFRETGPLDMLQGYPEYPLLVDTVPEAVEKLDELLSMSQQALSTLRANVIRASEQFDLENLSWRLIMVLTDVFAKTGRNNMFQPVKEAEPVEQTRVRVPL
ncbi:unnamed protein product [Amoebophrya sp. A25]|nr:unnamed protein product [Amoebophrya sp. A25]|eukprot:GSA25T00021290001.1